MHKRGSVLQGYLPYLIRPAQRILLKIYTTMTRNALWIWLWIILSTLFNEDYLSQQWELSLELLLVVVAHWG